MISPELYKNSQTYDFFIKLLGYQAGIDRYLRTMTLETAPRRVLDAGCGTGLLGLHFLQRFPQTRLLATDLEPNFLQATLANADSRKIDRKRIEVGIANISAPRKITSLDGQLSTLDEGTFDLICVGAVVGYADDTKQSLRELVSLLAPGGTLINIEMNESLTGRFVSHRYHYHNIPLAQMQQLLTEAGCEMKAMKLSLKHLPAKLTRTAIVARKK